MGFFCSSFNANNTLAMSPIVGSYIGLMNDNLFSILFRTGYGKISLRGKKRQDLA